MTTKTDIPAALADFALIDGPTCARTGGVSISQWHELVRSGRAPQPAVRAPRFTRWRLADIRTWLIEQVPDVGVSAAVVATATKASHAAQRVRTA